jgi:hypothetical protein
MVGLNSPFPWPHPPSDGYPAEALPVQLLWAQIWKQKIPDVSCHSMLPAVTNICNLGYGFREPAVTVRSLPSCILNEVCLWGNVLLKTSTAQRFFTWRQQLISLFLPVPLLLSKTQQMVGLIWTRYLTVRVGHIALKSTSPQAFFCCAATQTYIFKSALKF